MFYLLFHNSIQVYLINIKLQNFNNNKIYYLLILYDYHYLISIIKSLKMTFCYLNPMIFN